MSKICFCHKLYEKINKNVLDLMTSLWWNSSWAISNPERWCCESAALNMPANLENSAVATGQEKVHFPSNPKERQSQRMLKILQARLQHYVTHREEEPEIKLPISAGSSKKQESSRKTSISALLTMPKPLTVWITIICGKFWKRWEYLLRNLYAGQ